MSTVTPLKPRQTDLERDLEIENAKAVRESSEAHKTALMASRIAQFKTEADAKIGRRIDEKTAELSRIESEYRGWLEAEQRTHESLVRQLEASTARLADLKAEKAKSLTEAAAFHDTQIAHARLQARAWHRAADEMEQGIATEDAAE